MKTFHRHYVQSAVDISPINDESIDLVVTSPPYPMIEMWDASFAGQDERIGKAMKKHDGPAAFEYMHGILDTAWDEVRRVLKTGRFVCINIGDAVRTVGDEFMLYSNHARIISAMIRRGFTPLPCVLWRKQTNAPNKFMGSGMLPAGAYVTLEHEYVLIFRKGGKRVFHTETERAARRRSAVFWEERNNWYSDIWYDLKGVRQQLVDHRARMRSGAFPFDLPYRLINMYSVSGDTVLDPFSGISTTMFAAMASGRNSASFEIEGDFNAAVSEKARETVDFSNKVIQSRIDRHLSFVSEREEAKKPLKYINRPYGFPVMTRQETDLYFFRPVAVHPGSTGGEDGFTVQYAGLPDAGGQDDGAGYNRERKAPAQRELFQ